MTSVDTTNIDPYLWIDPIPGDDPYATIRKIRAEIHEETKHMTGAEYLAYLRKNSDEFWEGVERRRAERAKLAEANA
jgi:hypothetical protein